MKIGLITTLGTNIGDDFIRMGIQRVLRAAFPGLEPRWEMLNKHAPKTVWPVGHPCRYLPPWTPRWRRMSRRAWGSRLHGCDGIVQCGAPVIWDGCARCEWNEPVWQDVIKELHTRIPVMNLAIGSAYALSAIPDRIQGEADREYIKSILSYCCLTTARDSLAKKLVAELGVDIPLIPCSAGLALDVPGSPAGGDLVLVNYMPKAGHYDFGNDIDEAGWERVMTDVLAHIAKNFQVVFLCHHRKEMDVAAKRFPQYKSVLPESINAYERLAQTGRVGLFNRLHAAVAFAGMGIPSVVVGNDTRIMMVKEYGLPVFDVRRCSAEELIEAFDRLLQCWEEERSRLLALRKSVLEQYMGQVQKVMNPAWAEPC